MDTSPTSHSDDAQTENSPGRPLVAVRTLPLTNANYGGLLQAWALQRALSEVGFQAVIDASAMPKPAQHILGRLRRSLRRLRAKLTPGNWLTNRQYSLVVAPLLSAKVLDFTRQIQQSRIVGPSGTIDDTLLARVDAFVVGSDQVWRWAYGDVDFFLLGDIPVDPRVPRIAYAASFGTDRPLGFSPDRVARTRARAKQLTAVSVREASAITLSADYWGVEAERQADPTLLVSTEEYREHFDLEEPGSSGIVTYILDWSAEKHEIVREAERLSGNVARHLNSPTKPSYLRAKVGPERYLRPGVPEWVQSIFQASLVVTDSYHGCLFALIFNRPLLLVPNSVRGNARFETLFEVFGIRDRSVTAATDVGEALAAPVDWTSINAAVAKERSRGEHFLRTSLIPAFAGRAEAEAD